VLAGEAIDLLHVDQAVGADVIGHDVEGLTRVRDPHAVAEMATVGEVEPEDRVAGLQ